MIRIGTVAYANALPLTEGLAERLPQVEMRGGDPAEIARALESGELDLGLVPVVSWARHPEWDRVPGLGIASEGAVRSVLLFSRVPVEAVTHLVEDPASRTSNLLARLWLSRNGAAVRTEPGPDTPEARLELGEATVVIGDRALHGPDLVPHRVDLGAAWTEWTGLPFVFAVWAGPGAARPGVAEALHATYEANASRLEVLAARAAGSDPARTEILTSYYTEAIRYRLGSRETAGLDLFLERVRRADWLTPEPSERVHARD